MIGNQSEQAIKDFWRVHPTTGIDYSPKYDHQMELDFNPLEPAGRKDDTGKTRLDLLPFDALWVVGDVYTMGASKYDDRNWEAGIKYSRVFSALLRHAFRWFIGETFDLEDKQHHLASVVWCGLTLLHYDLNPEKYAAFDNRPADHIRAWLKK